MTLRSTVDNTDRVLVGLIGRGILASRSPRLHEQEAGAQGLRLLYVLFDFAELGLEAADLPRVLAAAELTGFAGVNVTHPYKQAIIEHLHELAPGAQRVGAVNTVAFRAGCRIGHNTDVTGFASGFAEALAGAPLERVLLVGAGGGGAAAAHALLELGTGQLSIHDIDRDKAQALQARLAQHYESSRLAIAADPSLAAATANGLVNATPMGMAEHPGMAVSKEALRADLWVAEIVYFPLRTALLDAARRAGCRVMNGSGMAIHQAAGAYEIFTGRPADAARMAQTFHAFDHA